MAKPGLTLAQLKNCRRALEPVSASQSRGQTSAISTHELGFLAANRKGCGAERGALVGFVSTMAHPVAYCPE